MYLVTKKFDCLGCHHTRVLTAVGICKHSRLGAMVKKSRECEAAAVEMRACAFDFLRKFIHSRERSKGPGERCNALCYASADDSTQSELLQALKENASFPPTGSSTGVGDLTVTPGRI